MAPKKVSLERIVAKDKRLSIYKKRKVTLFKKTGELKTLCDVKVGVFSCDPTKATNGVVSELEIWPRNEAEFRDVIRLYKETVSNSCKKETHVETFVNVLGKEKEMETNERVLKNVDKYSGWDPKLDKCSLEQLHGILCGVNNNFHEAVTMKERYMHRVHHQVLDTPIPQSLMDQNYMQQYFSEQPHFQSFPNNYNHMGFSFISPLDDQIQMDPSLMENRINLGLNQGLMMSKGNDGTQLMQRQAQPYYNREPVVQRSAAYNGNQFAGYQVPFNSSWRLSENQVEDWDLSGKKSI